MLRTYHLWKAEGAIKDTNNQLYNNMKASKKTLRQKQRQATANIRENKYESIMESAEFNQQLFYRLIREQRTTNQSETDTIILDDIMLSNEEEILNGWNTHFERLSAPAEEESNNNDSSELECMLIEQILEDKEFRQKLPDFTIEEVIKAISQLANGKAADHLGLTAEHFKKGGTSVAKYTTCLLIN